MHVQYESLSVSPLICRYRIFMFLLKNHKNNQYERRPRL